MASFCRLSVLTRRLQIHHCSRSPVRPAPPIRWFSKENDTNNDDPFGLEFEDGQDGLGQDLPPKYRRDAATGKVLTDVVQEELTAKEKQLLQSSNIQEKNQELVERLVEHWKNNTVDGKNQDELAKRIREEQVAMNPIGRRPRGVSEKEGEEKTLSQPLSPSEFKEFTKFMRKEYDVVLDKDQVDIPVEDASGATAANDNPDLDLNWLSGHDIDGASEAVDSILPSDFSPTRLVNRRKAKRVPMQLLHHNNLSLLRRYITPSGQIMNRAQSRLGASDQRRVAKMIKRARALGLIPHLGQFKVEHNGNVHETDLDKNKEWEAELQNRGLVPKK